MKKFLQLFLVGLSLLVQAQSIHLGNQCAAWDQNHSVGITVQNVPSGAATATWTVSNHDNDAWMTNTVTTGATFNIHVEDTYPNVTVSVSFKNGSGDPVGSTASTTFRVDIQPGDITNKSGSLSIPNTMDAFDLRDYFNLPSTNIKTDFSVSNNTYNVISDDDFVPSEVTGNFPYTVTVTCRGYYGISSYCFDEATMEITVYNGNAALPNFLRPAGALPICQNRNDFDLIALASCAGTVNIQLNYDGDNDYDENITVTSFTKDNFTGSYLYPFSINPSLVPIGGSGLIDIFVFKSSSGSGCPASTISGKIPVTPLPDLSVFGLTGNDGINSGDVHICSASLSPLTMTGFPTSGYFNIYKDGTEFLYEGLDTITTGATAQVKKDSYTFIPYNVFKDAGLGNNDISTYFRIVYVYPQNTVSTCQDSIEFNLRFTQPNATNFTVSTETPYCYGTPLELEVINEQENDEFIWEFRNSDDEVIKTTERSSIYNTYTYQFEKPGEYKIRLQSFAANDVAGFCDNDVMIDIQYGAKPIADFTVNGLIENQATTFVGSTGVVVPNTENPLDDVVSWHWNWNTDDPGSVFDPALNTATTTHTFTAQRETYNVTLITEAGWGCTDTIQYYLPVFKTITGADYPYEENFDDDQEANSYYHSGDFEHKQNFSSWENITADSKNFQVLKGSSPAWITSKNYLNPAYQNLYLDTSGYYRGERSWIETPYFDLSSLDRPIFLMDTWCQVDEDFDGVAFQYCIAGENFGEETWVTIGDDKSGLNWYNANSINAEPGRYPGVTKKSEDLLGWTGTLNTEGWKMVAYPLDEVKANAGTSLVRFRIAFASNEDNTPNLNFDGFAFDNFKVENRNRMVVLESFVSSLKPETFGPDITGDPQTLLIKHFVQLKAGDAPSDADLDDYNANKADPGVRALFYGLNDLPRTIIDGIVRKPQPFDTWGADSFALRRLTISPFEFTNLDFYINTDQELVIEADLENVKGITLKGPYTVRAAVVSGTDKILRKLLPTAAGIRVLSDNWTSPVYDLPDFEWKPLSGLSLADGIQIILFVQDEITKEIYQAKDTVLTFTQLTGIGEALDPAITQGNSSNARIADLIPETAAYPNPANNELFVEFETPLASPVSYSIQNNVGVEITSGTIANGVDLQRIFVSGLQSGFYSLTLKTSGDSKTLSFVKQ